MKLVKVLTKKVGQRNVKSYAEVNEANAVSIAFSMARPNMRLSVASAAALL